MAKQSSLKVMLYRTVILLNVVQQIRTLESESVEALEDNGHHHAYRGGNVHNFNRRELEDSSSENSVKQHQKHSHSNAIVRASANHRHRSNSNHHFNFVRSDATARPAITFSSRGCLGCQSAQENQQIIDSVPPGPSSLPEEILTQMRVELVKKQILKKLRLTEEPKAPKLPKQLPVPVALGETLLKNHHHTSGDRDVEDFYGKTEQIIVFPDDGPTDCPPYARSDPSSCFLFNLPKEIRFEEIESVEVWVYKLQDPNDRLKNQTFFVDPVEEEDDSEEYDDDPMPILIKSHTNHIQGWFNMNLTLSATNWLRTRSYAQTLQIGCTTCVRFEGSEDLGSPIGAEGEERPFIVFNMASVPKKKRSRRQNINCSPGVTECCRERFVVNFKEIGWNWIIGPESYEAYYCKGSCMSANSLASSGSKRTTIVQGYLNTNGVNWKPELVPCCTATRMSSISLIYYDLGENSTSTTRTRTETLPNMVVESCGCL